MNRIVGQPDAREPSQPLCLEQQIALRRDAGQVILQRLACTAGLGGRILAGRRGLRHSRSCHQHNPNA